MELEYDEGAWVDLLKFRAWDSHCGIEIKNKSKPGNNNLERQGHSRGLFFDIKGASYNPDFGTEITALSVNLDNTVEIFWEVEDGA